MDFFSIITYIYIYFFFFQGFFQEPIYKQRNKSTSDTPALFHQAYGQAWERAPQPVLGPAGAGIVLLHNGRAARKRRVRPASGPALFPADVCKNAEHLAKPVTHSQQPENHPATFFFPFPLGLVCWVCGGTRSGAMSSLRSRLAVILVTFGYQNRCLCREPQRASDVS